MDVVTGDLIKLFRSFYAVLNLKFSRWFYYYLEEFKVRLERAGRHSMTSEILKGTGRFEGIKGTVKL